MKSNAVQSDPEILGGEILFAGTRVSAEYLFNYLARGYTVDYFVEQFPTVSRDQATQLLSDSVKEILEPQPASRSF